MKYCRSLYFWVIVAFILGCVWGVLDPQSACKLEPLGTQFIKLVKVFITPIVFVTVTLGVAQSGSMKKLGAVGLKSLIYFEILSTIALLVGWVAALLFKPGAAIHADIRRLDPHLINGYFDHADHLTLVAFIQDLIPAHVLEPFIHGNILQALLLALLFGMALLSLGDRYSHTLVDAFEILSHVLFRMLTWVMMLAPLGVLGSMAFTVGKFGSQMLLPLFKLMLLFYSTGLVFIVLVLGVVCRACGFSLFKFLNYIRDELALVLATSSSEAALPQLLRKLESLGVSKETAGVVVPMGYSFNLDGTNIYITLAALFIAQALGIELTITQQVMLFLTAMVSSKGAAGVTGSGFITLAATLSVMPTIPPIGMVLVLGVDRFMSQARAIINFVGNGIAGLVISRWQGEINLKQLQSRIET